MSRVLRIIDANSNRAREALRVMEDAARFVLDDRDLCDELKSMRHALAAALALLPGGGGVVGGWGGGAGIAWRDTPGDVGTEIEGAGEYLRRGGIRDVAAAAGKRLSEALRSIEEYAKTIPETGAACARAVESLRYRGYEAERRLMLALTGGRAVGTSELGAGAEGREWRGAPQWRLCVIITESLCKHHPWLDVARCALAGGADCIQLREKTLDDRELLARARALVELARAFPSQSFNSHSPSPSSSAFSVPSVVNSSLRAAVIINDRPDIALLSGADGVHLGQTDMSVRDARRIVGFDLLIGVSVTNIDQARQALRDGADYCGVGPMFATPTKDSPGGRRDGSVAGPDFLRQYLAHDPPLPPHLAIGGITPENVGELRAAGCRGIAVSSAVCGAEEPERVCSVLAPRPVPVAE